MNRQIINKRRVIGVSYPKSGRTWLRKILTDLCINVPFTHAGANVFEVNMLPIDPDPSKFFDNTIIFLIRDPRDVLVSYYNDLLFRHRVYNGDIDQMAKLPYLGIEYIAKYNLIFHSMRSNFRGFYILKYEDMLINCEMEINNICKYLGCYSNSRLYIPSVVKESKFEIMKKQELAGHYADKYPLYWFEGATPGSLPKVRRGKAGGFYDAMSPSTLEYCNTVLRDLNYPRDWLVS